MTQKKILVIDDDGEVAGSIREFLEFADYLVDVANTAEDAEKQLHTAIYDAAVVDLNMPRVDGHEMLRRLQAIDPAIAAIMLTAYGTVDSATQAFKLGVKDFLAKPVKQRELIDAVRRALDLSRAVRENRDLRRRAGTASSFDKIIGRSPVLLEALEMARRAAPSDLPVVIQGETGVGKELVAAAIHGASSRSDGPLVVAVVAAATDQLQKSALFGHVKGAFTGADTSHRGFFQQADKGTLFFDEIVEVVPEIQVALLRALQEGLIRPAGADSETAVDVRLISATNVDLRQAVNEAKFREDLFYRLGGVFIDIPPLRNRSEDILPLARHFAREFVGPGRQPPEIDSQAEDILSNYHWPGNIRELKNVVERAVVLSDGNVIRAGDCRLYPVTGQGRDSRYDLKLKEAICAFEKDYLQVLLEQYNGDAARVAAHADVHVTSVRRKIREFGIQR